MEDRIHKLRAATGNPDVVLAIVAGFIAWLGMVVVRTLVAGQS